MEGITIVTAENVTGRLSVPANPAASLAVGGSLVVGTAYYYVITALDADGETLKSTEVTATPTTGNQTIDLSWDAVTGATSYKVYRSTVSGTYTSPALAGNPTTNSLSDDGVTLTAGAPPSSYDPEVVVGDEISVMDFDVFGLYDNYTKGNEDGVIFKVYGLHTSGGDEHQLGTHQNQAGTLIEQVQQLKHTSSGKKIPITYDVKGIKHVKVYQKRSGTTPATGTFTLTYTKTYK